MHQVAPSASAASMSSTTGSALVVDVDQLDGVARLGLGAGDDDRDGLTDVVDLVDGDRRVPG